MVTPFSGALVLFRARFSSSSKQQRLYGHVPRICVALYPRRRSFHSHAPFAAKSSHDGETYDNKNGKYLFTRFHTIIKTSSPSITTRDDILKKLAGSLNQTGAKLKLGTAPNVVILATPSFTTWLEGQSFTAGVIRSLFPSIKTQGSGPDVTVIAAVVDSLPSIPQKQCTETNEKNEGFAIMFWERQSSAPSLEQVNNSFKDGTSNIIFLMNQSDDTGKSVEITVPLANTLFRTGRSSTLIISRWGSTSKTLPDGISEWEFTAKQLTRTNTTTIHPEIPPASPPLHFDIPLQLLTPLREVVAGLGNIIRQVTGPDGKPVSASQELEASVDAYLSARGLDPQAVNVWALIIPETLIREGKVTVYDTERIRETWTRESTLQVHEYINQLLQKGAHLHRVLSGGGGWGTKAGLLSLDPETTPTPPARHDFSTLSETEAQSTPSLHAIASLGTISQPGSGIQFFISPLENPDFDPILDPIGDSKSKSESPSPNKKFIFGCLPSSIDELAPPVLVSSGSGAVVGTGRQEEPRIESFEGFFGALSERGVFVRGMSVGAHGSDGAAVAVTMVGSKVDVPFSRVVWEGEL